MSLNDLFERAYICCDSAVYIMRLHPFPGLAPNVGAKLWITYGKKRLSSQAIDAPLRNKRPVSPSSTTSRAAGMSLAKRRRPQAWVSR